MAKTYLWVVSFRYEFKSSSGMDTYSIPGEHKCAYVLTRTGNIAEVVEELKASLGCQFTVGEIEKATWLGFIVNP